MSSFAHDSNRLRNILVAFVLAVTISCGSSIPHTVPGSEDFFGLSVREQDARIVEYSPADQVGLYLTSFYFEPPYSNLLDAVARGGAAVLPAVLDRLSNGPDGEVHSLLRLLNEIEKDGYYSVAHDKHAMAAIRHRFEAMKIPQLKELREDDMAELEQCAQGR